jgi:hypothetical protein
MAIDEINLDDDSPPESFEHATPVVPFVSASEPYRGQALGAVGRTLPNSLEAEEYLLSCCMLDGEDVVRRCLEAKIGPDSFYDSKHGIIYEKILDLYHLKLPIAIHVIAEELKKSRQLDQINGYAFLTQVSSRIPTTAQAGYFIEKVREQAALRAMIRVHTKAVEDAYSFTGDIDELLDRKAKEVSALADHAIVKAHASAKSLIDFELVPSNDRTVVIGRRYLNRGDIGILVSSSGMGKSSMSIQMAVLWALGRPAFDIPCNGPQRSLIIQSEDSEGDIAEVKESVIQRLELTAAELAQVGRNVVVVTDRVNRGPRFFASLRRLIAKFKPDIVWINPLQAFLDGDIKESKDLGLFVREGLNGLNEPASHIYMLVHHTNKIGGGNAKDKAAPNWFDMMYAMAGGAELINAARAIMILEPQKTEGDFTLNLAKRGRRAGVRRLVGESQNTWETVTKIPLKHASGSIDGADGKMPIIYWEPRKVDPDSPDGEAPKKRGGNVKYEFKDYRHLFPLHDTPGMPVRQLAKTLMPEGEIKVPSLTEALKRWEMEGHVARVPGLKHGMPTHWRATKPI